MARIVVMFNNGVQKEFKIGKDRLRVGRDADNDIQLENAAVSRHHAEIFRHDYAFFIEDKDSTNGTYLNENAISWKASLNNRDRITIGKHTLVFIEDPGDYAEGGKTPVNPDATIVVSKKDKN